MIKSKTPSQEKFEFFAKIFLWVSLLLSPFTEVARFTVMALAVAMAAVIGQFLHDGFKSDTKKKPVIKPQVSELLNSLSTYRFMKPALLFFLFLLPLAINSYHIDVLTNVLLYCLLALGLNIVVGMAGLLDLGYISFYAIGAYSYALLSTRFGLSFWPGLLIGGGFAGILGLVLGLVTLRLRGDYLAIVTLGFLHIIQLVLNNWDSVTNGPNGIMDIPMPFIGNFELFLPIHFYYLLLVVVMLAVFVIGRLNNSRIGRAWVAIREDEVAAESMGVEVVGKKILAFVLGAFWAGMAGVIFAAKYAFVSPESFNFFETVIVLAMVVLGGMGTLAGPIVGAIIITLLPEFLRGFANYRMLIFGSALVGMMIFKPQGLIGKQNYQQLKK